MCFGGVPYLHSWGGIRRRVSVTDNLYPPVYFSLFDYTLLFQNLNQGRKSQRFGKLQLLNTESCSSALNTSQASPTKSLGSAPGNRPRVVARDCKFLIQLAGSSRPSEVQDHTKVFCSLCLIC